MKKYFIIFLFLSVFLGGCSNNDKINLNFQQINNIFVSDIKQTQDFLNSLWFSWFKNIEIYLDVFWENQDFKLKSELTFSWSVNYTNQNTTSNIYLDSYFWDKSEQQESLFSWKISNIFLENYSYYKVEEPNIQLWKWNFQWDLINIIFKNIKNKRIRFEKENKNNFLTHELYKNIYETLDIVWSSGTFKSIEKMTYEGNLAHKLVISKKWLNELNKNKYYKIKHFEWMFITNSSSEITLKIEEMLVLSKNKEYNIKWFVWQKESEIIIQEKNYPEKIKKINLIFNKKNIEIRFSSLSNLKEMFELYIKLYPQNTKKRNETQINSILKVSPILIYWSNLEKDIQININGQYLFQETENINIEEPESYILWQQILWDNFSLQTIMSSEKYQ